MAARSADESLIQEALVFDVVRVRINEWLMVGIGLPFGLFDAPVEVFPLLKVH